MRVGDPSPLVSGPASRVEAAWPETPRGCTPLAPRRLLGAAQTLLQGTASERRKGESATTAEAARDRGTLPGSDQGRSPRRPHRQSRGSPVHSPPSASKEF